MVRVTLIVNDDRRDFDAEADEPLDRLLRERCGLPGVRHGCTDGTCGECTVLLDGEETRSCTIFAVQCAGGSLTTLTR
ncbi:2Fe-2S iron-sulfur cluster-binding protein [Symbioplanes lichenis]|uniref:2Fe-2S iron-sulfur cluster-binding protein n=1 Tax=Symbioplanes lichenis TaxID=1629072 RepID=UPI00273A3BD0|nr:2Fe-2S iron-sulfur cluster-binding protein [Actinoplanes lichenis]